MKIRLTLTVTVLLLIAMLLINLVLIMLWKRNAVHLEAEHDQAVLAHVAYRLPAAKASRLLSFSEFYPGEQSGQIAVLLQDSNHADLSPLLTETADEVVQTGKPIVHSIVSFAGLLHGKPPVLVSAQPIIKQGRLVGAIVVSRSLEPVLRTLLRAEKITFIYMIVNLLVLGAICFFRMTALIVRPVERLAELAGQHNSQEAVWFAAGDSGSEFNRLANNLNRMLAKIEDDRQILRTTVAELEAANRQLHERQEEMIRAEKLASVGRLAAGLAHEIGNPLAVIQGYLGLLARSGQSDENQDFLRRADQELQRVSGLVRQLLDCARVSKGRPKIFSVHELLYSVIEMVRVQAAFKHIKLTVNATAERDSVYVDSDQLRQVLLNCLLNSADAINSPGEITITTDMLPDRRLLRLCIEDNGVGIAEDQLGAVFDPFYTTKEPGKGTGLGLSVSRSIIENAGGWMKMESKTGQGSTVSIYLPLADGGGGND